MKLGDLKIWQVGRNAVIRFPAKTGSNDKELALMTGMWLLENFVDAYCEDKVEAINVIAERMRGHIKGER